MLCMLLDRTQVKGIMQNARKMRTEGARNLDGPVSRYQFSFFVRKPTERWFNAQCNATRCRVFGVSTGAGMASSIACY